MDYKNLFRKIERNLRTIERSNDLLATLFEILRRLVDDFQDDVGLVGGRIYERTGAAYVLKREYPEDRAPRGFRVPATYGPIQELLERGYVYSRLGDTGVDAKIESAIGVKRFAAIGIGEHCRQVVAFTLKEDSDSEEVGHTLNTIRHAINLKLRSEKFADRFAEARAIQLSLLPPAAPPFADYDIAGASVPAEEVGGDLYDFILVGRSLGVAVADASGHGLPAALQARDAIIGLRMGVEENLRISATLEKLNRVVNHSALASKFISLFYGELESGGTIVYCNAGHNPPLLWNGTTFRELSRGGMILGPNPDAQYERGYETIEPGSVLLAYTDGIVEAVDPDDEPFGMERLRTVVRDGSWSTARELVDAVFAAVRAHAGGDDRDDDQTVVAVFRPAKAARGKTPSPR
ncbi:MAG TPA: PP2C family protein-serine/threonine phosphatase [Candidatus Polarisedimenticolaceae bacterium]|nr:PP2C family protein-serine/threonine phosphatase [Candidatus Polarisedimenticolaceae bacterium]